jgi:ABC-type Fe3+/spermidine/putrescine transport system ATPase subunit
MSTLSLHHVTKTFASTPAVHDINVDIPSGEFFSILGPSGCGKTTLLRIIAGFEQPTGGRVVIDGKDVTAVAPQRRGIGMVFQHYALFPHMTVFGNVSYGLEAQRLSRPEIRERVERVLASVDLADKMDTPVPRLSGGEQQRVAVARALVIEPAILLFDEPLSNLDVSLRVRTREEIRILQHKTGITTVYVTHDQGEAMSLSDRIAVMRSGMFEQVGKPFDLYDTPRSPFVAQFLGDANILKGMYDDGRRICTVDALTLRADSAHGLRTGHVTIAVKPESIRLSRRRSDSGVKARIVAREFQGFTTHLLVHAEGIPLRVTVLTSNETHSMAVGETVSVDLDWARCSVFQGW